ncbi:hypothetical protein [Salinibaculum rarum]|uniref:hypothetical protein n=1 Tax=Salinibaculum rarum TaxID=3058903 RepID=UPI00265DD173|nr:hypothetical protein [Salinibaculum sp. KK48]
MMAGIGVLFVSGVLWGSGITTVYVRDLGFIIGFSVIAYGIGIRDGIERVQNAAEDDKPVDADPDFSFPSREEPLKLRHFGVFAMMGGFLMWAVMKDAAPARALFWIGAFLLYGGTTVGFDLGIKRAQDHEEANE